MLSSLSISFKLKGVGLSQQGMFVLLQQQLLVMGIRKTNGIHLGNAMEGRKGCKSQEHCDIYSSCDTKGRQFGCGFVVGRSLRHLVSGFNPVNERLAKIRKVPQYKPELRVRSHLRLLTGQNVKLMVQPPFSPDFAPKDFFLFPHITFYFAIKNIFCYI